MAFETDFAKESENFRKRCIELEEKSKKDEMRCLMLEIEVGNLRKKNQELEGKIVAIQTIIVDPPYVENDSDLLQDIMVENKVLECEKRKAETELCFWKEKAKELELTIKGMNEKVKEDMNVVLKGSKEAFHSKVRKRLSFEEDGCHEKKMSPSTPAVAQSPFHGVIDINDEDVDYNESDLAKNNIQKTNVERVDEEHMDEFKFHSSNARSAKRKRAAKIIASDDEESYDDNAPICTLKAQHSSRVMKNSEEEVNENVSRRRLTRLRTLESNKTVGSSEDEEDDELESEGESLGGFIVNSSESVSKCDSESIDNTNESEDASSGYKETLEKISRKKISTFKWDLEGDMLADFGKDPELCMRAVCALYRQQTADEKECKVTIHQNERGFSQPDAPRASDLARFLTDGDSNGDLNKTVEELKVHDSKGIERCMSLAAKYSKQLFKIYQNKEDRYFRPQ